MRVKLPLVALVFLFAATACGDKGEDGNTDVDVVDTDIAGDTNGEDVVEDAALDTVGDTADATDIDSDVDTSEPDTSLDAVDAADAEDIDVPSDLVEPDTEPDTESDVENDVEPDTELDVENDVEPDTESDVENDVELDTESDVAPCGNAAIDEGEECDGDALADATCASLGFDGGELACSDCAFDVSACTGGEAGIAGGDFSTLDAWTTVGDVALVEEGGVILRTDNACEPASISQDVDFRAVSATDDVALAIRYRVASEFGAQVFMDESPIGTLAPATETQVVHLCINRGWYTEANLRFELLAPYSDCAASSGELVIEEIEVTSDERCDGLVAGDFEQVGGSPPLLPPWAIIVDHPTATGERVIDADQAAAGSGAVALTLTGHCGISTLSFSLASPELGPGLGLGLSFQARGTFTNTSASAIVLGGGAFDIVPIDDSETWARYVVCLGAPPAGTLVDFGVSLFGTDFCDEGTFEAETLWIDEVLVGGSPACPTM